tara:strand:+ start:1019 stop:1426 length:408 start_codon:yes stop_codon:yes gene_type:complete
MKIIKNKLKIINNNKGKIVKFFYQNIKKFNKPEEVYFSFIKFKKIKGWKLHLKQTTVISVVFGKIKIVIFDKNFNFLEEVILTSKSPSYVLIPPNVWYSFRGLNKSQSIICSLIDMLHKDDEQKNLELSKIKYKW